MAIHWQIPTFEQSNPFLSGVLSGQDIMSRFQNIQRQGLENQHLPEKLKEALLQQRLANQHQQMMIQYLPQEKELGIQSMKQQNEFYPQVQRANIANTLANTANTKQGMAFNQQMQPHKLRGAELSNIQTQGQIDKLQQEIENAPNEAERKRLEQEQRIKLREKMLENIQIRNEMATGERPTRVIQNQLQQAQIGIARVTKMAPEILKGFTPYLDAGGDWKRYLETAQDTIGIGKNSPKGSEGAKKYQEIQDRVANYKRAQNLTVKAAETMMKYGILPRVKDAFLKVEKIFTPQYTSGLPESKNSYNYRVQKELSELVEEYAQNQSFMSGGMPKQIPGIQQQEQQMGLDPSMAGGIWE